jgi:hypothetical protein
MSAERDSIPTVGAPESAGLGWSSAGGGQRRRRGDAAAGTAARPAAAPGAPAPIGESLERINARLATIGHALALRVTPETGVIVATVTDATGAVVEQIPSRDLPHLAELLQRWADGDSALVDTTA